ncbi:MAG TPA: hypothetical protein VH416_02115 [Gaiellaceae bacterium]|jgi:hypothetical protein
MGVKGIGFYEAAAQVIPILALLLVVELRLFDRPYVPGLEGWIPATLALIMVAFAIAGEASALFVLENERTSTVTHLLTHLGIWFQVGAIAGMYYGRSLVRRAEARRVKNDEAHGQATAAPQDDRPPPSDTPASSGGAGAPP